jgi:hypothetical protein
VLAGSIVTPITQNFIQASLSEAVRADPRIIIDDKAWRLFRGGRFGHAFYIDRDPSLLSEADVKAINDTCDPKEGHRNRQIKRDIAGALSRYFNDTSFHVTEFGSGRFPISKYFPPSADVSYRGIDCDPGCIDHLHSMNIPASDWNTALAEGVPAGKPAICVSIYAMHFMINNEFAQRIHSLTSGADGLFVGNFYVDPHEKETGEQREKLKGILAKNDLTSVVLKDPADPSNEYWVISKPENLASAQSLSVVLQKTVEDTRGKTLRIDSVSPAIN